jgi:hypothetical protein
VVDFGGWLDNWSWSASSTGKVPLWLQPLPVLAGLVGLGCLAASFLSFGVGWSAWMLLALVALPIDLASGALEDRQTAIVAYGHTLLLCGVLALVAFELPAPGLGRAFAVIAPCLALGTAPVLLRIWAATLFARDMIEFVAERRAAVRAALARESDGLVVRVTRVDGDQAELVTLGSGPELQLVARAAALDKAYFVRAGACFWLGALVVGELESPAGYRGPAEFRRIEKTGDVHWLASDPERYMKLDFADEVRAGALVMLVHHGAIAGIALALSHVVGSR